ncbi:unnamed protein product [Onchocerca flexuosa]|uniref:Uncharacterized protein n=1 Tax=Onchocerca flexuosa TaxID=387005 RepID=A0A183I2Z5_9BILA|nr:unnamed protein product [Onchocerca flexuosa]
MDSRSGEELETISQHQIYNFNEKPEECGSRQPFPECKV